MSPNPALKSTTNCWVLTKPTYRTGWDVTIRRYTQRKKQNVTAYIYMPIVGFFDLLPLLFYFW